MGNAEYMGVFESLQKCKYDGNSFEINYNLILCG